MWTFPSTGSHLPFLCRAFIELRESNGDVLELGCGEYSTHILHELCANRNLVSLDNDPGWVNNYILFKSPKHDVRVVESWDNLPEYHRKWDIVLVDQAPGSARIGSINALANNAKIIIIHDTEDPRYGYAPYIESFIYKREYTLNVCRTYALSNFIDISEWNKI